MDTPKRNNISGPPLSKFEDSPVFNYINSLSPIQPVRSTHIAQSFNSLSFASLPSVFTSPHVSAHKESRFLKRHHTPDPSKPQTSPQKDGEICSTEEVIDSSRLQNEPLDPTGEGFAQHSKPATELPQALTYASGSPEVSPTPCAVETGTMPKLGEASASASAPSEGQVHQQRISQTEPGQDTAAYEWESLLSDATDLLIFNSPDNTEAFKELLQRSLDRGSRYRASVDDMNVVHSTLHVDQQAGPSGDVNQIQMDSLGIAALEHYMATTNANDKANNEPISNLHRGMRRRCLDFETAVAHRKNLGASLHCKSLLSQFEDKIALSGQQQHVDAKPSGDSLRRILPGIGLHLNALAASSKCETSSSGRQIINLSCSIASFTATQEPTPKLLPSSTDDNKNAAEDITEDAYGVSPYLLAEESNPNSPQKKRRRVEQVAETETSCKRCNCKKSKCLKLYCECFAAGVYCIEPCSCQDCFNKPIHEDTVLATRKQIESRNPLAFAPKVIRSSDSVPEIGDESSKTPASARHKRGCNCKKSSCLKKYCECYQGGVGCSINCRCEGCKNTFGRKDGCSLLGAECEQEEEESEVFGKDDKALQKCEIQNNDDQNPTSVPMTPLQLYRPLMQLPFSSKSKPPRSSFHGIGSSSGGCFSSQKFARPSIIRSEPKSREDEMPEALRESTSPSASTVVKTGSPNSKRVSSPHCNFRVSPTKRSGRKLILQSIPSFPSLTQH